jgi:hypothetical protein
MKKFLDQTLSKTCIIRTFTKLRSFLSMEASIKEEVQIAANPDSSEMSPRMLNEELIKELDQLLNF